MRILLVSVLLGLTAACAAPPAPPAAGGAAAPTAADIAAALGPAPPPEAARPVRPGAEPGLPPAPVAVAPPPPVAPAAPVIATVDYVPMPLVWFKSVTAPAAGGRLTLSNFSFDAARVQAVLASGPDCTPREDAPAADFVLPLNATRILPAPPGADICWRRELPPTPDSATAPQAAPSVPGWAEWNRAYTASGRFLDSRL